MFVVGIWSARLDSYSKSGTRPVDFFTRFVFAVKPQQLRSRLVPTIAQIMTMETLIKVGLT